MKPWFAAGALALGLGSVAGGALPAPVGEQDASPWYRDLDSARAASRQAGKPVFLVFR